MCPQSLYQNTKNHLDTSRNANRGHNRVEPTIKHQMQNLPHCLPAVRGRNGTHPAQIITTWRTPHTSCSKRTMQRKSHNIQHGSSHMCASLHSAPHTPHSVASACSHCIAPWTLGTKGMPPWHHGPPSMIRRSLYYMRRNMLTACSLGSMPPSTHCSGQHPYKLYIRSDGKNGTARCAPSCDESDLFSLNVFLPLR